MTPNTPPPKATPWWQSLISTVVGAAVTALLGHYFGPAAGAIGAGVVTGVAHTLPNPQSQAK